MNRIIPYIHTESKRVSTMRKLILLFMLLSSFALGQVSVVPNPWIKAQYFDNSGNPCSGCKLYTYTTGTTSALATYTDATGTVQNTNPVVMDSAGRPPHDGIFLQIATYREKLTTSTGSQIWQIDGLTGAASSFGTNLLPSTDNTYDIGSSSKRWKSIYAVTEYIGPLLSSFDSYTQTFFAGDTATSLRAIQPTNSRGPLFITQDNTTTDFGSAALSYFRDVHTTGTRSHGAGFECTGSGGMVAPGITTTLSGCEGYAELTTNGTVTNLFGIHIRAAVNSGGGTATNAGGLFIDSQTVGTNPFSILTMGGTVSFQGPGAVTVNCGPASGASNCTIQSTLSTVSTGNNLNLLGGNGTDQGTGISGGTINITANNGTGTGGVAGAVNILSGNVAANSAQAGAIRITSGNGTGTSGLGGDIIVTLGIGTTGGRAGQLTVAGFEQVQDFLQSNNTARVTTDFTTANNTNFQTITGLTWNTPAIARSYILHCSGTYSQATAAVLVSFGIQAATNAPTNIYGNGTQQISIGPPSTSSSATLATLTTTTATAIVSGTPGATATNYIFELNGTVELPASLNVVNIMVSTAAGADAVTIRRGCTCSLIPTT